MRVILAFDDLTGEAAADFGEAFWLARSSSNLRLAEAALQVGHHDVNSAVFDVPHEGASSADVLERVDDIDLHHPEWDEIRLTGAPLTPELRAALGSRNYSVEPGDLGIAIRRARRC